MAIQNNKYLNFDDKCLWFMEMVILRFSSFKE